MEIPICIPVPFFPKKFKDTPPGIFGRVANKKEDGAAASENAKRYYFFGGAEKNKPELWLAHCCVSFVPCWD